MTGTIDQFNEGVREGGSFSVWLAGHDWLNISSASASLGTHRREGPVLKSHVRLMEFLKAPCPVSVATTAAATTALLCSATYCDPLDFLTRIVVCPS